MRTGIEFFDRQGPKAGDLWIVAGGPGEGKTTVLRNLVAGFAKQGSPVLHWDVEHAAIPWKEAMGRLVPHPSETIDYRNDADARGRTDVIGVLHDSVSERHRVVAIDSFGLVAGQQQPLDVARQLKVYAVRRGVLIAVTASLRSELWSTLQAEGRLHPSRLEEWMVEPTDAIFLVGKTPQREIDRGTADTLRVQVCSSPMGLRDPENTKAFIWDHATGRIE